MVDQDGEEPYESLAEHRLGRSDMVVKLDRGFEPGVYGVCIEYAPLAERIGFTAARRYALDYACRLHGHLARAEGHAIDDIDDASQSDDLRRKHDLDCRFMYFALMTEDGCWQDDAIKEKFRIALLRTDQERDQHLAGLDQRRRNDRRERFRQQLEILLAGDAYLQMDGAMKERLLAEVTEMVFPARGTGLYRETTRRKVSECSPALLLDSLDGRAYAALGEHPVLVWQTAYETKFQTLVNVLCPVVVAKHISSEGQGQLGRAAAAISPFKFHGVIA